MYQPTTAQRNDIEIARYFIPNAFRHIPITQTDEQRFLSASERGTEKWSPYNGVHDGFGALSLGKSRRGLNMEMYEQGILEGTMPYWTLLGGEHASEVPPPSVVNFMSRELFKGIDRELILKVYEDVQTYHRLPSLPKGVE